jgi:hypothetical protein
MLLLSQVRTSTHNTSTGIGLHLIVDMFAPPNSHALVVHSPKSTIPKNSSIPTSVQVMKMSLANRQCHRCNNVVFFFHASANGHFIIYYGRTVEPIRIESSMAKVDTFSTVMIIMFTKHGLCFNHVHVADVTYRCDFSIYITQESS